VYVRVRDDGSSLVGMGAALVRPPVGAHAPLRRPAHAPAGTAQANGGPEKPKRKPKPSGPSKNRLSAQEQAERAVEEAEGAMRALEEELATPQAWASRYESAKSEARHTAARRAVEEAYARLETLID
jgi:ATP-binding cassette subfamily F protein 3